MSKPDLATIRAWVLMIFGCVAIIAGILQEEASWVMTGFAVLGTEPTIRAAANGKLNGKS